MEVHTGVCLYVKMCVNADTLTFFPHLIFSHTYFINLHVFIKNLGTRTHTDTHRHTQTHTNTHRHAQTHTAKYSLLFSQNKHVNLKPA